MKNRKTLGVAWGFVLALSGASAVAQEKEGTVGPGVPAFTVRAGYKVTLAADKLDEARFIEFDDKGNLYLAQPGKGKIIQLRDKDGDGVYETRTPFIEGQRGVHG